MDTLDEQGVRKGVSGAARGRGFGYVDGAWFDQNFWLTWLTLGGVNLTGGTDGIRACDNPEDLFLSKTGVLNIN